MQKLLIAGLGNPGSQYAKNRHNIGFMVLDVLASELGVKFSESKNLKSYIAVSKNVILCKPTTFMNASGEALCLCQNYYKSNEMLVVHDELEIPYGALRFKRAGGHGGHNGLKSIDIHCGNDYIRARCGIGRPEKKSMIAQYVLSDFKDDPRDLIDACMRAICFFIQNRNLHQVQNLFTLKV